MMYNIDGASPSAGKFASGVTVVEQKLTNRWRPLFYGAKLEGKLKFDIVFGVNQRRIDNDEFLDRYELEAIGSWLTGHDKYLWLEINQDDMNYARYRCIISDLELVEFGNTPMALRATVTCDGPYAYMYPQVFEYTLNGTHTISFYNESSHNGFYYPIIEFVPTKASGLKIVNHSDGDRTFELTSVPSPTDTVVVNNDTQVISCYDGGELTTGFGDIYEQFNFNFLRLLKGENSLSVTGKGTLRLRCEFPVNVGG